MASQKTNDASKAPKSSEKEELTSSELDKVVGGMKKNIGVVAPKGGSVIGDPCEGGE